MTDTTQTPAAGFYGLGIAPKLLEALDKLKFTVPTPIQQKAIPVASEGKDMVGIAQTGTGKTIAFAIPMIQRLAASEGNGLVLVPTRELALQVAEVIKQFSPIMGMGTAVIIGGESLSRQVQEIRRRPRIIIATPGRLIDHLKQRNIRLDDVRVLILDEADRMFDMGFAPQIKQVIAACPKERQTMLFSATMPDEIMKLAAAHMKLPIRIEVARSGTLAEKVEQELFVVDRGDKPALLAKLLDKYWGSVLLFVRTKHNAKKIAASIRAMPHSASEIHSNRSLAQRREALEGFKSGKYRVLVATDIAARGIDVTGIELVINYDLPDEDENYVHRIGRTGRAGQPGRAITFASPDQRKDVRNIERLIRMPLAFSTYPEGGTPGQASFTANRPSAQAARPAASVAQPEKPAAHHSVHQPAHQPAHEPRPHQERSEQSSDRRPRGPRQGPPARTSNRTGSRPSGPRRESSDGRGPAGEHAPRAPFRGGPRRTGRPDSRGPNRYGVKPGSDSRIVSPSPYFEEPRRGPGRGNSRSEQPRVQAPKPQEGASWFSRFLKKKNNHE